MAEAVFLGRDGQQLGPYDRTSLMAMVERGEIRADDLAWHEGLEAWQPAAAILERLGIRRAPEPAASAPLPAPQAAPAPAEEPAAAPAPDLPWRDSPLLDLATPQPAAESRRPPAVPGWMMGELEQAELYEVFLGAAAQRYLPIFQRFDAGEGSTSWNLPAGLITQLWMVYRGLYLWGLVWYPLLFLLAGFVVGSICTLIGGAGGGSLSMLVFLPGCIAVMGLYGDRIYHDHARARIEESGHIGLDPQRRQQWLRRKGGTHLFATLLVLGMELAVLALLVLVAKPAYQDYLIRSQVQEGVDIAGGVQHAVAGFYAGQHYFPPDNAGARLPAPEQLSGHFVRAVEVQNGTVLVSFAADADPHIAGAVLAFVPQDSGGHLAWRCGGDGTSLQERYRPQGCQ